MNEELIVKAEEAVRALCRAGDGKAPVEAEEVAIFAIRVLGGIDKSVADPGILRRMWYVLRRASASSTDQRSTGFRACASVLTTYANRLPRVEDATTATVLFMARGSLGRIDAAFASLTEASLLGALQQVVAGESMTGVIRDLVIEVHALGVRDTDRGRLQRRIDSALAHSASGTLRAPCTHASHNCLTSCRLQSYEINALAGWMCTLAPLIETKRITRARR